MMRLGLTMRGRTSQRGTVVVEMALVLPFMLVLMLATAELGRLLVQSNTLTQSARDAVRFLANEATVGTTDVILIDAGLEAQAKNLAVYGNAGGNGNPILPGFAGDDVTVSNPDTVHVTVAVSYVYRPLMGAAMPMLGLRQDVPLVNIPLRASVTMRAL